MYKNIVLLQVESITNPGTTWVDMDVPTECIGKGYLYLAEKFRCLQQYGRYRVILDDGSLHYIVAYETHQCHISIDGEVQGG